VPYNLTDFENGVASRIQDGAGKLLVADRDNMISQAVRQRYSHDRPREMVSDVTADGSANLPLPQGTNGEQYEDGFSTIRSLEYLIGNLPPTYIENDTWMVYRTPTGLVILLMDILPNAGEKVRVAWTVRHTPGTAAGQNAVNTTIPDADFEAVCDLAASLCCTQLAAIYAQTRDPSIGADAVNYRTKSQEYLTLAKALQQRYFDHVGIEEGAAGSAAGGPAGGVIAIGSLREDMGSGVTRLLHRRPR
jgi:hypothetical protein